MNEALPTRAEFGTCLDAVSAWKNFGGKSLDEAFDLFWENPMHYREAFMFMGEGAFRFYYPVIDRYLQSGPLGPPGLLESANILALGMQMRFDYYEDLTRLHEPMLALCDHVLGHLGHYEEKAHEQQKIAATWSGLRQQVADDARGIRKPRTQAADPRDAGGTAIGKDPE